MASVGLLETPTVSIMQTLPHQPNFATARESYGIASSPSRSEIGVHRSEAPRVRMQLRTVSYSIERLQPLTTEHIAPADRRARRTFDARPHTTLALLV